MFQELPADFDIKQKLDDVLNTNNFCEQRARKMDIDSFIEQVVF